MKLQLTQAHLDALVENWRRDLLSAAPALADAVPGEQQLRSLALLLTGKKAMTESAVAEAFKDTSALVSQTGFILCSLRKQMRLLAREHELRVIPEFWRQLDLKIEEVMLFLVRARTGKEFSQVLRFSQELLHFERLAVTGQLAAGLAHEIGNPLSSISSIVQLLMRKNPDPDMDKQLQSIKSGIDRIARIVRGLVDYSRPATEESQNVNVNALVKEALNIIRCDKRFARITLLENYDETLPPVAVIPDQVIQVFVNLFLNALDAMHEGGELRVESRAREDTIAVIVRDNGSGIDPDHLAFIFEPFFTTRKNGHGTGLGLSVSDGIIRKFGGSITVESTLDRGSAFTVILPARHRAPVIDPGVLI